MKDKEDCFGFGLYRLRIFGTYLEENERVETK